MGERTSGRRTPSDEETIGLGPGEGKERPLNTLANASFVSKLLFIWPYPLMKTGLARPIEEQDLPDVLESDSSAYNLRLMNRIWDWEKERASRWRSKNRRQGRLAKPSLHRAILRDFLRSQWHVQVKTCLVMAAQIGQALALGLLIEYFGQTSGSSDGYLWAGVLVLCALVALLSTHSLFFSTWRKGMQYRIASIASIYSKSLRLPSIGGINSTPSGRIVNLATNDVDRFILATVMGSYLFWGPVQAIAVLFVGLNIIGPAFAAGFAVLFIFVVLQFYLGKWFAKLRSKIAAITDLRVTVVSQAVAGARVVKMNGWEWQFDERISRIRNLEVSKIQEANRLKAWNEAVFFACNVTVSLIIFVIHVTTGGILTPRNVFTTMSLVNIVQFTLTKFVALAVMGVSECYVSIRRIQNLLELPELAPISGRTNDEHFSDKDHDKKDRVAISLCNLTCHWNSLGSDETEQSKEDSKTAAQRASVGSTDDESSLTNDVALQNVTLGAHMGQLCCIIGPVGSGKSTLLEAIVGELPASSGEIVRSYTSLAYAAQDPWIMDGTVRENITMGQSFDSNWYGMVVAACGLTVDFAQFRNGDNTVVGDRGVQCSGGQRARIGLARALYRDADVLLLDDPLSAVDSKVGRLIFYAAIQDLAVKRGKCVILATHQHQFIGDSRCVLMTNGRISCIGTYSDCIAASGGSLSVALQHTDESEVAETKDVEKNSNSVGDATDVSLATANSSVTDVDEDTAQMEMSNIGEVKRSTYVNYAKAMGGIWVALGLILLFAITQASVLAAVVIFGEWAELPFEQQDSFSALTLSICLGVAVAILSSVRALASFYFMIKASQFLHDRMTKAVLRAKIEFFDTNPLGRILNRFSADVGSNDDMLPQTMFDFLMCAFIVLGGVATSFTVLPITLLALPPLILYFVRVRRTYVTTSRELKRLEGLSRSPIFSMLSESLAGIGTIRANDAVDYFRHKFERIHDTHSRAFFQFIATSRWLGFRMDAIMWMLLSLSSFLAVLFHDRGWFNVDPAILGLALTMLLQLAGTFQWSVRQSAEVVNMMVSVERVIAFGDLRSEADLVTDEDSELTNWPSDGSLSVNDLTVRYRENLPPSLNEVCFNINGGERIGVVGRTGSGKSTLVQALFRILEAEGGTITIDGVDISTLGLHKLRTEMSVIPQSPVLFSGTNVRENLDPFQEFDDTTIETALADVQMLDVVKSLQGGLDFLIAESGSNFSVGQRQLLCLARAILRKKKILVLDEPTANVDSRTDELLQEAVRRSFNKSTIIAVAHRLDTIIDYDRILVMGMGRVIEFGSPRELLANEEGHFASMVADTGERMAKELHDRAKGM